MKKVIISVLLGASVMLSMLSPAIQPLNAKADDTLSSVNGLVGEYYTFPSTDSKYSFQTLKGKTIDATVNSSDFTGKLTTMTGQSTFCAVRWTGEIEAQATGSTTFSYYGDNGVRLWVNGQLILDHWVNDWNVTKKSTAINLTAGQKYDFKMEYFQATGGANISLSWSTPSFTQREITSSCFFLPNDYTGAVITGLDTSQADLQYPGISGTIGILGSGLAGSKVEILDGQGAELSPSLTCAPLSSSTDSDLKVNAPASLSPGPYEFLITNGVYRFLYNFDITRDFGTATPRPEYPRPDWERSQWMNLNGKWDFDFDPQSLGDAQSWQTNHSYSKTINVPYCWESSLSGVGDTNYLGVAWYKRSFSLDDSWAGKKVILNFGAVDWRCKIWVNGTLAGTHEGGYDVFDLDITQLVAIGSDKTNTIVVRVEDYDQSNPDVSERDQLVGKQGADTPAGYTHTSGIWQTVYLTARDSDSYIVSAQANPDIKDSSVTFKMDVNNAAAAGKTYTLKYDFKGALNDKANGSDFSGQQNVSLSATGENTFSLTVKIPDQKLWDSDNPNLYNGSFELCDGDTTLDSVSTYFGQREVSEASYGSNSYQYVELNGKPVFLSGALLQGFWQDGIYTAPEASSYLDDIKAMKSRGFNMLRMHIKIEDPMFYYYADKTGMMVWQDMPWGQNFNKDDAQPDIGRVSYENCLNTEMARDYNHPSIISIILFNENWGIHQIADTQKWMASLYNDVKATHPGMLVEDMTGYDHIQPTDLVDYHEYQSSFSGVESQLSTMDASLVAGSQYMFQKNDSSYVYNNEPWFNAEYGGVGCGDGDKDVSWCFKYQTSIMRLYQRLNGFVYTEPYDIEYERNGVLNYNRTPKTFGYDEIAYGGDMSMADLTQPNFIGFYNSPVVTLKPGDTFTGQLGAINWSGNTYSNLKIKWRFDATDAYGNNISTGLSGEMPLDYTPYTTVNKSFSFKIPISINTSKLVGTVTAWIEDANGSKIAKNFTNIVVTNGSATPAAEQLGDNAYALRQQPVTAANGSATYAYTVPSAMDISSLKNLRVIAELSSVKPGASQTSDSEQSPSDVTVSVNGHEITTVTIPDDPRDIRGTLSLSNDKSSATDFGYLLNLNIPDSVISQLKSELASSKNLTVTYAIKGNAKNNNGLQFYGETNGRYAVTPMVVLNAPDTAVADISGNGSFQKLSNAVSSANYSVEADVTCAGGDSDTAGLVARADGGSGYVAAVSKDGSTVTLSKLNGSAIKQATGLSLGAKAHLKITLFDTHIRVFANNGVVPVIDTYDASCSTGGAGVIDSASGSLFSNITVSPESYDIAAMTDQNAVALDKDALTLGSGSGVISNLTLPQYGSSGTTISWASSNPDLVGADGSVIRPAYGLGDATVTLTATISKNSVSDTKTFNVTVKQGGPLVAQYTFDSDAGGVLKDVASGNNGQFFADAAIQNDSARGGSVLVLNGSANSYAKLPAGIMKGLSEMTVSAWVKCNSATAYQRLFDFGTDTNHYIMLTISNGANVEASIKNSVGGTDVEQQVCAGTLTADLGKWHHVAVTIGNGSMKLYIDGTLAGENDKITYKPSDLGNTTNNYIGKSQWPDPNLNGSVDDFRIYGYALTGSEIGDVINNKIAALQIDHPALSVAKGSTAKLSAFALPANAAGTTAWSSSDPSVVTVDQSGNVTAVSEGTATVTATAGGKSVTSTITVTAAPASSSTPSSSSSTPASSSSTAPSSSSTPASSSSAAPSSSSAPASSSSSAPSSSSTPASPSSAAPSSSSTPASPSSAAPSSSSAPSGNAESAENPTESSSEPAETPNNVQSAVSNAAVSSGASTPNAKTSDNSAPWALIALTAVSAALGALIIIKKCIVRKA